MSAETDKRCIRMENILSYSAVELGAAIKAGKTTAVEAMEAVLESIGKKEKEINAYVTVDKERALEKAAQTQKKIEQGELTGALAGVPAAIKDNMCTAGLLTTCSSKILENFVPTYTAEAVLNLEKAGAVVIGKTNMDEFAMGSTTETSAYGVTRNPRNLQYVPGGSSGGGMFLCAWLRYRRFDKTACRLLWRSGHETDIRHCLALWADCLWLVT